ncbi:MAG: hypothetical protein ACOX8S_09685 [Christensenellales bacterium]
MSKIFITGSVASGKTTLAKELSSRLGAPWFELDSIVHKRVGGERVKQSPEEQMREILAIDTEGKWIFEGVFRDSYRGLLGMADIIIFLDAPLWKRRYHVLTRFIRQKLGAEPCGYKPNLRMLWLMYKWTRDFERNRSNFTAMLDEYRGKLIVISKPAEVYEQLS